MAQPSSLSDVDSFAMSWFMHQGFTAEEAFQQTSSYKNQVSKTGGLGLSSDHGGARAGAVALPSGVPGPSTGGSKAIQSSEEEVEKMGDLNEVPSKKVKMPGSQVKRFQHFLRKGYSRERALIESKNPYRKDGKGKKKGKSSSNKNSERKTSGDERSRSNHQQRKHSPQKKTSKSSRCARRDTIQFVKIGIVHVDYPSILLSKLQLTNIQNNILAAVTRAVATGVRPAFQGVLYRPGMLAMKCRDSKTAEWLHANARSGEFSNEAPLKAIEADYIYRGQIAIGYFPQSEDESENDILELLHKQNSGFNIECWRVLGRREEGHKSVIRFNIDTASAAIIKASGLKANYKFDTVPFKLLKMKGARAMKREFESRWQLDDGPTNDQGSIGPMTSPRDTNNRQNPLARPEYGPRGNPDLSGQDILQRRDSLHSLLANSASAQNQLQKSTSYTNMGVDPPPQHNKSSFSRHATHQAQERNYRGRDSKLVDRRRFNPSQR